MMLVYQYHFLDGDSDLEITGWYITGPWTIIYHYYISLIFNDISLLTILVNHITYIS
jgi:hypothetical protein